MCVLSCGLGWVMSGSLLLLLLLLWGGVQGTVPLWGRRSNTLPPFHHPLLSHNRLALHCLCPLR